MGRKNRGLKRKRKALVVNKVYSALIKGLKNGLLPEGGTVGKNVEMPHVSPRPPAQRADAPKVTWRKITKFHPIDHRTFNDYEGYQAPVNGVGGVYTSDARVTGDDITVGDAGLFSTDFLKYLALANNKAHYQHQDGENYVYSVCTGSATCAACKGVLLSTETHTTGSVVWTLKMYPNHAELSGTLPEPTLYCWRVVELDKAVMWCWENRLLEAEEISLGAGLVRKINQAFRSRSLFVKEGDTPKSYISTFYNTVPLKDRSGLGEYDVFVRLSLPKRRENDEVGADEVD